MLTDLQLMKVRMMQEKTDVMDIGQIVSDFGFPIVAAVGMGYFIYYISYFIMGIILNSFFYIFII